MKRGKSITPTPIVPVLFGSAYMIIRAKNRRPSFEQTNLTY